MSAEIGASLLTDVFRILENEGIDTRLSVACLASAVCGCLKATGTSPEMFMAGVVANDDFWIEEDGLVVFDPPDIESVEDIVSETLNSKETN